MMLSGFISYSHKDHELCAALREHLSALEHAHEIKFWCDRHIHAGRNWSPDIDTAIRKADIFLYLMSPSFFDSSYIMYTELPAITAKFDPQKHLNLPILARECCWDWKFGSFQAVPSDSKGNLKAVDLWKPKNSGWNAALTSIRTAIETHFNLQSDKTNGWGRI